MFAEPGIPSPFRLIGTGDSSQQGIAKNIGIRGADSEDCLEHASLVSTLAMIGVEDVVLELRSQICTVAIQ